MYNIIQTEIFCISIRGKGTLISSQHLNKRVYARFVTEPNFKAVLICAKSANECNFSCYCVQYFIQITAYTLWRSEESQPYTTLHIKIAIQNVKFLTWEVYEFKEDLPSVCNLTFYHHRCDSPIVTKDASLLLNFTVCFSKWNRTNFEIPVFRLWQSKNYFTKSDMHSWYREESWGANLFCCPAANNPSTSKARAWEVIARSLHFWTRVSRLVRVTLNLDFRCFSLLHFCTVKEKGFIPSFC